MILELLLSAAFMCEACVEVDEQPPVDTSLCADNRSFQDGGGGNLWKPKSDRDGTLTVLLAENHEFDFCEVRLRDGSWTGLEFSGRTNGNRETYRGDFPGGPDYAGKKANGGVRCFVGPSTCKFDIPGAPKKRWD